MEGKDIPKYFFLSQLLQTLSRSRGLCASQSLTFCDLNQENLTTNNLKISKKCKSEGHICSQYIKHITKSSHSKNSSGAKKSTHKMVMRRRMTTMKLHHTNRITYKTKSPLIFSYLVYFFSSYFVLCRPASSYEYQRRKRNDQN